MKDNKNNNKNLMNINDRNIVSVPMEKEMSDKFLNYAMSVIISRALPNVDDGLKPVHRRILYAMYGLKLSSSKPYKKSARVVGEVIGKYHPHGDSSVYEAMTRMIQKFVANSPLVDGHGNFGSVDGDSPAAMRYTEVRLSKIIEESLAGLEQETVRFLKNYDETEKEPEVLPGIIPNLLLNGSSGIAVGMATSIPPHNLIEIIESIIKFIENPFITIRELVESEILKGPDFPTGSTLVSERNSIIETLEKGKGSYQVRANYVIEEFDKKKKIVFNEIPFQVNKSHLIKNIAELIRDKKILGITDLKDESNRLGIRIVITLKSETDETVILYQLFKLTKLQSGFSVNSLALHDNQPELMGVLQIFKYYVEHQIDVIVKKTIFLLKQYKSKIELLKGIALALINIDEIITLIKKSLNTNDALKKLIVFLNINERQAKAVLEIKLQKLTTLEREKILNEILDLENKISENELILGSEEKQKEILKNKLIEIKNKYGEPRKTKIVYYDKFQNIEQEDLIVHKDVLVCVTRNNYLKRMDLTSFRSQKKGGVGVKGITLNENDKVKKLIVVDTRDNLLFFTNLGKVYQLKTWKIPDLGRTARGTPVQNLIGIKSSKEKVRSIIKYNLKNIELNQNLFFVTKKGIVKKTPLKLFSLINKSGKIAIKLKKGDNLSFVFPLDGEKNIIISKSDNKFVRFSSSEIKTQARATQGVIGTRCKDEVFVNGACFAEEGQMILSISSDGKGKITKLDSYRITKRGAKGVLGLKRKKNSKDSEIVSSIAINKNEEMIIARSTGKFIISSLTNIRVTKSRFAKGAKFVKLDVNEKITAVSIFTKTIDD